ncbi:MAG: hypothetical protein ACKOD2_05435 [Ilumatobacteraceae bacterium]
MSRIERGSSIPTLATLMRLLGALGGRLWVDFETTETLKVPVRRGIRK